VHRRYHTHAALLAVEIVPFPFGYVLCDLRVTNLLYFNIVFLPFCTIASAQVSNIGIHHAPWH